MPEEFDEEFDCYADREPTVEDLRLALDEGLKPYKRRVEQVEYIVELLTKLMPDTSYSVFISAIKNN